MKRRVPTRAAVYRDNGSGGNDAADPFVYLALMKG
jgi:hypothetical protein